MHTYKIPTKYFHMNSVNPRPSHLPNHLCTSGKRTGIEELLPGLTQEYLAEQQIICYSLSSPKSVTITAWGEVALENLTNWPRPLPYRALHDLSRPGVGLVYSMAVEYDLANICVTPVKRKMVHPLLCRYPEWSVALAVVVPASLSGHVVKAITARTHADLEQVRTKFFFDRQAALQWLEKLDSP
jgi:hypothetical protein